MRQRVIKSLYAGAFLTLIFTGLSLLFMLPNVTWITLFYSVLISALFSFGLGSGSIIITAYLDQKYDWYEDFDMRLRKGIPIVIVYYILIVLLINFVVEILLFKNPIQDFWSLNMLKKHFFYFMLAIGVSSFFYARGFLRSLRKSAEKQIQLEKEKVLLKYDALKNQIDPHFFFNNLNVLSSLIEEDIELSQEFIQQMTRIYRYVLSQKSKELANVSEELDFVRQYVYLQKARFEEGVHLKIDVEEKYYDSKVVVLSMQLLLENIFKHNTVSDEKPIFIEIFVDDNNLIVRNNINLKTNLANSTKLGLNNIKDRYCLLSDRKLIVENNGTYFSVCLPLL